MNIVACFSFQKSFEFVRFILGCFPDCLALRTLASNRCPQKCEFMFAIRIGRRTAGGWCMNLTRPEGTYISRICVRTEKRTQVGGRSFLSSDADAVPSDPLRAACPVQIRVDLAIQIHQPFAIPPVPPSEFSGCFDTRVRHWMSAPPRRRFPIGKAGCRRDLQSRRFFRRCPGQRGLETSRPCAESVLTASSIGVEKVNPTVIDPLRPAELCADAGCSPMTNWPASTCAQ